MTFFYLSKVRFRHRPAVDLQERKKKVIRSRTVTSNPENMSLRDFTADQATLPIGLRICGKFQFFTANPQTFAERKLGSQIRKQKLKSAICGFADLRTVCGSAHL